MRNRVREDSTSGNLLWLNSAENSAASETERFSALRTDKETAPLWAICLLDLVWLQLRSGHSR